MKTVVHPCTYAIYFYLLCKGSDKLWKWIFFAGKFADFMPKRDGTDRGCRAQTDPGKGTDGA